MDKRTTYNTSEVTFIIDKFVFPFFFGSTNKFSHIRLTTIILVYSSVTLPLSFIGMSTKDGYGENLFLTIIPSYYDLILNKFTIQRISSIILIGTERLKLIMKYIFQSLYDYVTFRVPFFS